MSLRKKNRKKIHSNSKHNSIASILCVCLALILQSKQACKGACVCVYMPKHVY